MTAPRTLAGRLRRRFDRRLPLAFPPTPGNLVTPLLHGEGFHVAMVDAIRAARRSADVEMYLWDDDEVGRRFVAALRDAAARGVRVRAIVDAYGARAAIPLLFHAVRARYGRYLRRRVRLHEYDAAFYRAKLAVFDRSLAVVGSSNLDRLSWLHNSELDLAITDAGTVDAAAALFLEDLGAARAVALEELRFRAAGGRVLERFALLFERWL